MYIYIYTYRERERERERESERKREICMCIYIYIYIFGQTLASHLGGSTKAAKAAGKKQPPILFRGPLIIS